MGMAKKLVKLDEAVERVTHYLAERAKLGTLDQEEIAGVHGGTAMMNDPDEPRAAALLRSDLEVLLDGLKLRQRIVAELVALTPPDRHADDDLEMHELLTDGWNTAHGTVLDIIRKHLDAPSA